MAENPQAGFDSAIVPKPNSIDPKIEHRKVPLVALFLAGGVANWKLKF